MSTYQRRFSHAPKRRQFRRGFKIEAIKLVTERGVAVRSCARQRFAQDAVEKVFTGAALSRPAAAADRAEGPRSRRNGQPSGPLRRRHQGPAPDCHAPTHTSAEALMGPVVSLQLMHVVFQIAETGLFWPDFMHHIGAYFCSRTVS